MAYTWITATNGSIPEGAAVNGHEQDGRPLFVCRAFLNEGLHPGKVRPEFGAANIPFGGREVKVGTYQVLMNPGRWVAASGGLIPEDAVVAGHEADGEPLFVARAIFQGGLHPGKVRLAFKAANVGFANKEQKAFQYEVLVDD